MSHKFKVGDRVRVIGHRPSDASQRTWFPDMDRTLEAEGEVVFVGGGSDPCYFVRFASGRERSYRSSWLTPVDSDSKYENVTKPFKRGDIVRVKSREWLISHQSRPGPVSLTEGKLARCGQVLEVGFYDSSDNTYLCDGDWFKAEWLEPVDPEAVRSIQSRLESYIHSLIPSAKAAHPIASKLPLINSTKLLTNIKLD